MTSEPDGERMAKDVRLLNLSGIAVNLLIPKGIPHAGSCTGISS